MAVLPLFYLPFVTGPFETPKTALLRAAAIAVAALLAIRVTLFGRKGLPRIPRLLLALPAAAVAWAAVSAAASSNRALSAYGLLYVASIAVLFVGVCEAVRHLGRDRIATVLIVPAVLTSGVLVLQWLRVWTVIPESLAEPRLRLGGLFGNPDYVAAYLLAPAILAIAAALASEKRARFAAVAVALIGGIILTQSFAALASLCTAVFLIGLLSNWKRMLVITGLAVLIGAGVLYGPWRARAANFTHAWAERDYDGLTSGRAAAFLAAWEMFKDHPLTGAGVSMYAFDFMPYRLIADSKYGTLQFASRGTNFAEAHNDHLEILAETGVPGYALFLAALAVTASASFRRVRETRRRTRELAAFPLAAAFAVLALAQFPISISGVIATWLVAAAVVQREATTS